jgi:signal transduction histidine kinase
MRQVHVVRRLLTELVAAVAFPALLLSVLATPVSAAVVAELDRSRATLCGAPVTALRPPTRTWAQWVGSRVRSRAVWRRDLPVFLGATVLSAVALVVAFFGFVGAVALVFSPVFWLFGVAAQVGPFVPQNVQQTLLATPAGVALFVVTTGLLTGVSLLRDVLLRAVSTDSDPALLAAMDELRASRASLNAAFEEERRRIERDLHDGAQQELVAVVMRLGMLEAVAEAGEDQRVLQLAEQARAHAELALERLRETVRGIHPRELSDLGLDAAVRELAARSPLQIDLAITGDDTHLSPPTAAALYFTISEALTNVAKHSGVDTAQVSLQFSSSGVRVRVHDDGAGGARIDAGAGLSGLRERMRSVGGSLEVHSPEGGGTTVVAAAPHPASV